MSGQLSMRIACNTIVKFDKMLTLINYYWMAYFANLVSFQIDNFAECSSKFYCMSYLSFSCLLCYDKMIG